MAELSAMEEQRKFPPQAEAPVERVQSIPSVESEFHRCLPESNIWFHFSPLHPVQGIEVAVFMVARHET